jgi:hypothetical protein
MPNHLNRIAIDRVIRGNLSALRKPGVMTVRPGFSLFELPDRAVSKRWIARSYHSGS